MSLWLHSGQWNVSTSGGWNFREGVFPFLLSIAWMSVQFNSVILVMLETYCVSILTLVVKTVRAERGPGTFSKVRSSWWSQDSRSGSTAPESMCVTISSLGRETELAFWLLLCQAGGECDCSHPRASLPQVSNMLPKFQIDVRGHWSSFCRGYAWRHPLLKG